MHGVEDAGASRFWGHAIPVRNSKALHCDDGIKQEEEEWRKRTRKERGSGVKWA